MDLLALLRDLSRVAARLGKFVDPRTVRLRDPRPKARMWIGLAAAGVVLVGGAAALAANGRSTPESPPLDVLSSTPTSDALVRSVETARLPAPEPGARHPYFFDPIYVFTETPATAATAYPMADPPGVVVNLVGTLEPAGSPASMVGQDSRIRAVRRRATADGLRYVIGMTTPIERIEIEHEGNVVLIFPLR
jgi:hypothetical protein